MPSAKQITGKIDQIDINLGERLRLARTMRGMSQETLGKLNSVSFQQIQKYEKGTNRISVSRLVHIADCLGVPVSWFLEKLSGDDANSEKQTPPTFGANILLQREVQELLRAYFGIADNGERRFLRHVMTRMAAARH